MPPQFHQPPPPKGRQWVRSVRLRRLETRTTSRFRPLRRPLRSSSNGRKLGPPVPICLPFSQTVARLFTDSKRTIQRSRADAPGSLNSLRYQPTACALRVVSMAFQSLGTVVTLQPASERCAKKRLGMPWSASSWRKYHVPPSSNRLGCPSRISRLLVGFCTLSAGGGPGVVGVVLGGAPPPPVWARAGPASAARAAMTSVGASLCKRG